MEILNCAGAAARLPPGELSRALLETARAVGPRPAGPLADLAAQLHGIEPRALVGDAARTAFWLNIYNALFLHATSRHRLRFHLALHLRLFRTVGYRVGALDYTLDVIEHGLLRGNQRPHRGGKPVLDPGDERLAAAPARVDPRIHFALNCGARSCPPIRTYEAKQLDDQLRLATSSYLATEARIDRTRRRIRLPGLMRIYSADFGTRDETVAFVADNLPGEEGAWLSANAARVGVRFGRFDARVAR